MKTKTNEAITKSDYHTTDIYLASFLLASGYCNLKNILDSGGRKTFVLTPIPEEKVIIGFYSGLEKVPAIKLFEILQSLKSATYVVNQK